MEYRTMDLGTLAGGALPELFHRALDELMANVQDPNTPAEAKRKITVEVTFAPREARDGSRREGEVTLKVSTKLAGVKPAVGNFFYSSKEGETYTNDPIQADILEEAGVHTMRGRKAGGEG